VDADQVFRASARERREVADLLDELDDEQLDTPSLCAGWQVRTVAAHLVTAVAGTNRRFAAALLRARGNLHRANDALAHHEAQRPGAELAARLREHADTRSSPPVVGPRGPLTDVLVHSGDIRVPLGRTHDPDPAAVRAALQFVTAGRPLGFVPRSRLTGLRFVGEDVGWTAGSGPELRGRGIDVLMAACGRRALLHRLSGPGVPVLARRLSAP
jgi:uncharacterized protein (TIGR03083 family)